MQTQLRIQKQIKKLEMNIQKANNNMLEFMRVRSRTLSVLSTLRREVYDNHHDLQATKIATGAVKVLGTISALALAPFTGGTSLGVGAAIGLGGIACDVLAKSGNEKFTKTKFKQIEDRIKHDHDAICRLATVCTDIESDSKKLELMISGLVKGGTLVAAATTGVTRSITMMSSVLKLSKQTAIAAKGVSAVVVQTYTLSNSVSNTKILVPSMQRNLGLWSIAVSIPIDIYALIQDIKKYYDGMHKSEAVNAIDKLICDLNEHRDEEKRKFDESIQNYKTMLMDWKNMLGK